MHKVLVHCLVKLAQEKSVVRLTDHLDMAEAVDWDLKPKTKQTMNNLTLTVLNLKIFIFKTVYILISWLFRSQLRMMNTVFPSVCNTSAGFPRALENLENQKKKFHAWKNHGI